MWHMLFATDSVFLSQVVRLVRPRVTAYAIVFLEVVQYCWDAGQRVEDPLLRTSGDWVQHVEEVMVEGRESDAAAQRQLQPVLDAADRCVGVACIQTRVVQDTSC